MPQDPPRSDRDDGITLIPAARPSTCPACQASISWRHLSAQMYCPECHAGLQIHRRYFQLMRAIGIAVTAAIVYLLGFRHGELVWITLLASVPVSWIVAFVNVRLFPIELEATSDVRGVLLGPPPIEDSDAAEGDAAATLTQEPTAAAPADGHVRVPHLAVLRPARTLEGGVLWLAALVIVAVGLWNGATWVKYRLFPDTVATLTGPPGFAISAAVGPHGVEFRNGSTVAWSCAITIGYTVNDTLATTRFRLDGGASRIVLHESFTPPVDSGRLRERQRAARSRMQASCTEESGRGWLEELR